jgi:hypothetical protein
MSEFTKFKFAFNTEQTLQASYAMRTIPNLSASLFFFFFFFSLEEADEPHVKLE